MSTTFSQDEIDAFVSDAGFSTRRKVLEWISSGVPVSRRDKDGRTALYLAIECHNQSVVASLLKAGANPNQVSKGRSKQSSGTPLTVACENGDHASIKALLAKGAHAHLANPSLQTPAHCLLTAWGGIISQQGNGKSALLDSLQLLFESGASPDQLSGSGSSLLSIAIRQSLPSAVLECLLEGGASPNRRHDGGVTATHMAASSGATWALPLLKKFGADVNAVDEKGRTALFVANGAAVTRELLALGADPSHVDVRGGSPLLHLIDGPVSSDETLAQMSLLLDAGADPGCRDLHGRDAFDTAVEVNFAQAEALLRAHQARSSMKSRAMSPANVR